MSIYNSNPYPGSWFVIPLGTAWIQQHHGQSFHLRSGASDANLRACPLTKDASSACAHSGLTQRIDNSTGSNENPFRQTSRVRGWPSSLSCNRYYRCLQLPTYYATSLAWLQQPNGTVTTLVRWWYIILVMTRCKHDHDAHILVTSHLFRSDCIWIALGVSNIWICSALMCQVACCTHSTDTLWWSLLYTECYLLWLSVLLRIDWQEAPARQEQCAF